MSNRGFVSDFDKSSKLNVVKQHYWQAKEAVRRRIKGKKSEEDEFTGSDRDLAAKLELFKSIQLTSSHLFRFTKTYIEKIQQLQTLQNDLGEYLRTASGKDKTHAGKMFLCVGKSMLYSSELLSGVVKPLGRLQNEIEVFRRRAVLDTQRTVDSIEKNRREYRAVLMWMKDASQELDPESFRHMENFRRIQSQVKKSKSKFDKHRRDTIEKVDILAASRCNMFGGPLQAYTEALLVYWEKASGVHEKIAKGFQGYHYYDFSVVKELKEVTKELADRLPSQDLEDQTLIDAACADMDQKLFFKDYSDTGNDTRTGQTSAVGNQHSDRTSCSASIELDNEKSNSASSSARKGKEVDLSANVTKKDLSGSDVMNGEGDSPLLLDLDWTSARGEALPDDAVLNQRFDEVFGISSPTTVSPFEKDDLPRQSSGTDFWDTFLSSQAIGSTSSPDLPQPSTLPTGTLGSPLMMSPRHLQQMLPSGQYLAGLSAEAAAPPPAPPQSRSFLPSSWLGSITPSSFVPQNPFQSGSAVAGASLNKVMAQSSVGNQASQSSKPHDGASTESEKFSWYRQFAELDPLENPDFLGLGGQSEGA